MQFRFSYTLNKAKTARRYDLPVGELPEPQYNISPGQTVLTLTEQPVRKLTEMTWGIAENLLKEPETLVDVSRLTRKPFLRTLLVEKRCLVLADGFYIWRKISRKSLVPYRVALRWNLPFTFAGIWHERIDEETGEIFRNCAILGMPPENFLQGIVPQIPIMLAVEAENQWLSEDLTNEAVYKLLKPYPATALRMFPVSSNINNPHFNAPELLKPNQETTDQFGNFVLFAE
ncbi:MAG: SOS response-associated peptidase [Verrucomicrobia bacterium]|nr:SOS response-associated peptidase [Cytophagales bacterium]